MASFNQTGVDGLPPIVLPGEANLTVATVETSEEFPESQTMDYRFPNLGAVGTVPFGLGVGRIAWKITIAALSIAQLDAFERKVRRYLYNRGGKYVLISELGQVWNYCELVGYRPEPIEACRSAGGVEYVRDARVLFEDRQPATGL